MLRREQIKANLGTLNSATDGDMDIAFALLLAAKVRPPCVLEILDAAKELSYCMCCPSTLQLPTVMGGQALQCFRDVPQHRGWFWNVLWCPNRP